MNEISQLQKHIGAYRKTKDVYAEYRKLAPKKQAAFYEQHRRQIVLCEAAKRYFNDLGMRKLQHCSPKIKNSILRRNRIERKCWNCWPLKAMCSGFWGCKILSSSEKNSAKLIDEHCISRHRRRLNPATILLLDAGVWELQNLQQAAWVYTQAACCY